MRDSEYRQALVTYIDILGFRSLLKQSEGSSATVKDVRRILRSLRETSKIDKRAFFRRKGTPSPFEAFGFSDLTVRIINFGRRIRQPYYASCLISETLRLAYLQCRLACRLKGERPVLLRGGLTVGAVQVAGGQRNLNMLFGPALVRAYELESNTAVFPRIVVDWRAVNLLNPFLREMALSFLLRGDDGIYFVNYLIVCREFSKELEGAPSLKDHKIMIETQLRTLLSAGSSEVVIQKYLWLANYHNSTVKRMLSSLERPRLYISETLLKPYH